MKNTSTKILCWTAEPNDSLEKSINKVMKFCKDNHKSVFADFNGIKFIVPQNATYDKVQKLYNKFYVASHMVPSNFFPWISNKSKKM